MVGSSVSNGRNVSQALFINDEVKMSFINFQ